MKIVLPTNSEDKKLEFYNCKKFGDGSGYRVDVHIYSNGFSAKTDFFFEEFSLGQFIESLSQMSITLQGKALLKPMWEDDHIEMTLLELGHVAVRGEFKRISEYTQQLNFGFETDQTALAPFTEQLRELSNSVG